MTPKVPYALSVLSEFLQTKSNRFGKYWVCLYYDPGWDEALFWVSTEDIFEALWAFLYEYNPAVLALSEEDFSALEAEWRCDAVPQRFGLGLPSSDDVLEVHDLRQMRGELVYVLGGAELFRQILKALVTRDNALQKAIEDTTSNLQDRPLAREGQNLLTLLTKAHNELRHQKRGSPRSHATKRLIGQLLEIYSLHGPGQPEFPHKSGSYYDGPLPKFLRSAWHLIPKSLRPASADTFIDYSRKYHTAVRKELLDSFFRGPNKPAVEIAQEISPLDTIFSKHLSSAQYHQQKLGKREEVSNVLAHSGTG